MAYRNLQLQRETTRRRVQRWRANNRMVTPVTPSTVTPVTPRAPKLVTPAPTRVPELDADGNPMPDYY